MNVKDLIAKLQKLPEDMLVHVDDSDGHSTYEATNVYQGLQGHGKHKDQQTVVIIG